MLAILDGTLTDASEARIPATDDGFLRGDGAFEVIRLYGGRPFALDDHLARLSRSAANLRLPLDADAIRAVCSVFVPPWMPSSRSGRGTPSSSTKTVLSSSSWCWPVWTSTSSARSRSRVDTAAAFTNCGRFPMTVRTRKGQAETPSSCSMYARIRAAAAWLSGPGVSGSAVPSMLAIG